MKIKKIPTDVGLTLVRLVHCVRQVCQRLINANISVSTEALKYGSPKGT